MIAQIFVVSVALVLGMVLVCIVVKENKGMHSPHFGVLMYIGAMLFTIVMWLMPFVVMLALAKLIWKSV